MNTAVILALTLASVLSMNMLATKANLANSNTNVIFSQPQKTSNLQISNYTGSAITSQMASVFIKFINEAYHLYTNDITQNCEYIKNKL
jgi:P pilus assembly chaperone PapD